MRLIKKIKTLALLALFVGPATLCAQNVNRFFAAARVGDKVITNYEVHHYIQNYVLTDKVRMDLFTIAGSDLTHYQRELGTLSKKLYEDTLDRMIYQRYIEQLALAANAGAKRELFRTTTSDYNQKVEQALKEHLKPFAANNNPRVALGEFLQLNHYPHEEGEEALTTYKRWEENLRFKVKEDLRVANVSQAEITLALKSYPRAYENPARDFMAVSRYSEREKAAWKKINGKIMTKSALAAHMNGRDQIVLQSLQTLGPASALKDLRQDRDFLGRQLTLLAQALEQKSLQTPLLRLEDYSALALKLANTSEAQSLQAQKEEALSHYMAGAGRGELVSARILALAQEIQLGPSAQDFGALDGHAIFSRLQNRGELENFLERAAGKQTLEEALLEAALANNKNMMKAERELARDVLKAVIAEAFKDAPQKIKVNFKEDFNMKEYDLIKNRVQNQFTAQALKHYRSGTIYQRSYLLMRDPTGQNPQRGENVVDRIIP